MALYRVIQSVMELHASKKFTTKIARFCANVILEDDGDTRDDLDDVAEELKADYKIGGVYESYAQRAGNGIIFYLFVLPSKLYEKCLNKTSDVDNVLGHYSSLGFQQEDSTTSAANSIVSFITKQFNSQVSIFKSSEADQKVKPTRKNGQKKRTQKTRTQKTSKRAGKNRQFHSPQPTFCQPSDQSAETTVDGSLHATNPNGTEFPSPMNSPRLYDGTNLGLSHSSMADVEASAHSFHEYESPITAVEPMNHAISGESIVSLSNVSLNASQTQPLALSGMFNNAAHLMNEFQLEPMTYGANAAQLMHEFHLETFSPADYTNAAQLMQQFDMSNGYYGQQHL
ncbi:uncharacterized protein N7479_001715 [Penicillium vulpinum]|nr:uncharacterized protein N7479_001715 [Penicillium vulpinum]KAJ5971797.1 hypothetical protein N7479_001715 [Penicillium vulpinum]